MKRLLALFAARNKEYYRDKSSLVWSFIMPPLILGLVALAFGGGDQKMFKAGILGDPDGGYFDPTLVQMVAVQDRQAALQRVAHHQLDLLLEPAEGHYWFNPASDKGKVLQALLQDRSLQARAIEGRPVRYVDWVVPGILGMNIMFSALWGIGYVIVRYRKNGVLKRLQATPTRPLEFLGAQLLSRMLIMLLVSTVVYLSCDLFLDFLMLGAYWHLILIAVLGNLAMLSVGLVVAARIASEEFANGLLNFVSFPLLMVSEVWFSLAGAPHWLVQLANLSPLTHMVKAARAVMIDGAGLPEISHHLLTLGLMSVLLLGLATWLFRWRED